jgi:hypothetical protein
MITQIYIHCPGCCAPLRVRLGMAPTRGTRFYVPCPVCQLPIKGYSSGTELTNHRVEFQDASIESPFADNACSTVTIDPNVPLRYDAASIFEWGSSPNIAFAQITQDNAVPALKAANALRSAAAQWSGFRHFYEYYLAEQWVLFDSSGRALYGEHWPDQPTPLQRESLAQTPFMLLLLPTQVEEHGSHLFRRFSEAHLDGVAVPAYRAFAAEEVQAGRVRAEMRRTFDVIDSFLREDESWASGVIRWSVDPSIDLSSLRLCRDEFPLLRDLYQQAFEATAKSLRYVVASINQAQRGSPTAFPAAAPAGVARPSAHPVRTFAKFDKLVTADKLAYVYADPEWQRWLSPLLDRQTRNAIGHNSVRHDLRKGFVVTDRGDSIAYFDFVGKVYRMTYVLTVVTQVLRSFQVLGTGELSRTAVPGA